jgi:hypothetical protein
MSDYSVIANGYLRLDPHEWIRAIEKRRAALGRRRRAVDRLRTVRLPWVGECGCSATTCTKSSGRIPSTCSRGS